MTISFWRYALLTSLIFLSTNIALAQSQSASAPQSPPDWARRTYVMAPPSSSSQPHIEVSSGGSCPQPAYPRAALRTRAQGTTTLHLKVDPDGHVMDRDIVQQSGPTPEHRLLDIALDQAFRYCSFPPATEAVREMTLSYAWRPE